MTQTFSVRSMSARLRRVAVRTPTLVGNFPSAGWRAVPSSELITEHRAFIEVLEGLSVRVDVLDPVDGQVDAVYAYDPVFVTSAGAVVLNQIKPARVAESTTMAADLERLGVPILGRLSAAAHADGGDMMWLDEDTLAIGRGFRTNRAAIDEMSELLAREGIAVVSYDLAAGPGRSYVTHLMSFISPVARDKAVVHHPSLPVALLEWLEEHEWTLISCDDDEYDTQGCNVLGVAQNVAVLFDSAPKVSARLQDAGVEVHEVRAPNIALGDGGPTCITRPLWRED
ncbi:MAG: arginine deiminase family protein [Intrasporangium sp.]|uniref:dimethylarginine dimethylaminohydrolase family protein n=1 Tax=Intrasporangium sp. TaxID=1925024 RepID=UPI002647AA43|nr:arginine deiminase family protein [Intrasporangium sp.]MDN5796899.1 arginine deiminase family protein [Intrasporangium sp.]